MRRPHRPRRPPAPRLRGPSPVSHGRPPLQRVVRRLLPGGLWRHPDFLKLWAGQAVSGLGSQITPIALPLTAAVTLQATPAQMGVLRAAEYLPPVLVGLFAGVWVDRLRRRPLLLGTSVLQALLLLAVPAAAAAGLLRVEALYGIAFALGVLGVVFGTAYAAYLPALVPPRALIEANGKLATTGALASVAGPGLGGLLVQLLTAPGAVAVDGLSYLASALGVGLIRAAEPAPPPRSRHRPFVAEITEGLSVVVRDPILRAFLASSAALDVFWNGLMAVYFLFLTRELGLPPAAFGLVFGVGSVGALAGAAVASRVARRAGVGRTLVWAQVGVGGGGLLIGLAVLLPALALPLLVAAEAVQSATGTVYGVTRESVEQAVTPSRLRGRVRGSRAVIGAAAVTAGSLLGGLLGERIGLGNTMLLGAGGGVFAFVWVWRSPIWRLQTLPAAPSVALGGDERERPRA